MEVSTAKAVIERRATAAGNGKGVVAGLVDMLRKRPWVAICEPGGRRCEQEANDGQRMLPKVVGNHLELMQDLIDGLGKKDNRYFYGNEKLCKIRTLLVWWFWDNLRMGRTGKDQ